MQKFRARCRGQARCLQTSEIFCKFLKLFFPKFEFIVNFRNFRHCAQKLFSHQWSVFCKLLKFHLGFLRFCIRIERWVSMVFCGCIVQLVHARFQSPVLSWRVLRILSKSASEKLPKYVRNSKMRKVIGTIYCILCMFFVQNTGGIFECLAQVCYFLFINLGRDTNAADVNYWLCVAFGYRPCSFAIHFMIDLGAADRSRIWVGAVLHQHGKFQSFVGSRSLEIGLHAILSQTVFTVHTHIFNFAPRSHICFIIEATLPVGDTWSSFFISMALLADENHFLVNGWGWSTEFLSPTWTLYVVKGVFKQTDILAYIFGRRLDRKQQVIVVWSCRLMDVGDFAQRLTRGSRRWRWISWEPRCCSKSPSLC